MAVLSFSIVQVLQQPVAVIQGWAERPQQLSQHGGRAPLPQEPGWELRWDKEEVNSVFGWPSFSTLMTLR